MNTAIKQSIGVTFPQHPPLRMGRTGLAAGISLANANREWFPTNDLWGLLKAFLLHCPIEKLYDMQNILASVIDLHTRA
jgi:hypothetical protein